MSGIIIFEFFQVFAPLMLIPRNATILVGSTLEVSSRGGPKPDVNIEYQVQNGDILGIDGSVVEGLKVGKTKVVGRCVGRSISSENQQVVFSEDVIYITVINLHGIKIKNPLSRMKTEAVMPVSVWGDPDISPLVLGTLRNLKVHWSTTASDIIEINGKSIIILKNHSLQLFSSLLKGRLKSWAFCISKKI